MDFRQIQLFLSAATHLNFTSAARECFISQQGLSQQIISMENEIGFPIFTRKGHSLELTLAGKIFASEMQIIYGKYKNALREGLAAASGLIGYLNVGYSSTVYNAFLVTEILTRLHESNPDVELNFEQSDAIAIKTKLEQSLLDIIVIARLHMDKIEDQIDYISLGTTPIELALHNNHPLANKDVISWDDLQDETFIINKDYRTHTENEFQISGYKPKRILNVSNHITQVLGVSANVGVTFLPRSTEKSGISDIVFRPVEDMDSVIEVAAIWLKSNQNPALPFFVSTLIDE
jgi:DNA-binding transcriptional LysR family regulator